MYCLLIGLVPPSLDYWNELKAKLTRVRGDGGAGEQLGDNDDDDETDLVSIDWVEYCTAIDEEDNDTLTLLASAWTRADSQVVCAAVKEHLQASTTTTPLVSCEVWASAPAPLPLRPPKGYQVQYNTQNLPKAVADMQEWGIVIQQKIVHAEGLDVMRQMVDETIATTEATLQRHHPTLQIGKDDILFQEIASRNVQRFDLRLQGPHAISFVHEYILAQPSVAALVQETLQCTAEEMDFDVSVVYSKPGACAQHWHADGAHQKGAPDAGWTTHGYHTQLAPPYAMCLFVPLVNLNETVGYTQFWPGSHRYRDLAGFGPVAALAGATLNDGMKCTAGDGIWYDYRLLHRGMPNTSSSTIRPILQVVFKKKWYVEQANYGVTSMATASTQS